MNDCWSDFDLADDLRRSLRRKGYDAPTPVQEAVLKADTAGADLRITSVTGSGKTLAIAFALRTILERPEGKPKRPRGPRVLAIVPTRELARQVRGELGWLFEERRLGIESVTGGTSRRDERRALGSGPMVIVGTPGRLHDHLRCGAIDTRQIDAVVLDEADRMLDLGFQEDLQAILEMLPSQRRTHMASATFCDAVGKLANRFQDNPLHLRGTPLGEVNVDIEHVVHPVNSGDRLDAVVNLLLQESPEPSLIFARTRAEVAAVTRDLARIGFAVTSLSGDMSQPARDRALGEFQSGSTRVLVATDVAARGLDFRGVAQIIHLEPPGDPDSYVHRSGRTGRAGHRGTSHVLCSPSAFTALKSVMRRAGVKFQVLPVPTAEAILARRDQKLFVELTQDAIASDSASQARLQELANRLCAEPDLSGIVTRLLSRLQSENVAPRVVRSPRLDEGRNRAPGVAKRSFGGKRDSLPLSESLGRGRVGLGAANKRSSKIGSEPSGRQTEDFGRFQVTWGEHQGADARRLLAVVCRKGRIHSQDVGAIRIGATTSVIEIRTRVAEAFARAARAPDRRDPGIRIAPLP